VLVLYLYPGLFGLPDNNPFGLKVDTFLRAEKIDYCIEHTINTQNAPRNQLPYIDDNSTVVSDSNNIIKYIINKFQLSIDNDLTEQQHQLQSLIISMLDSHLYWVISYSRWQDPIFWPIFKKTFLDTVSAITEEDLNKAQKYNQEKYYYQGIGRYALSEIYDAGIRDLKIIASYLGEKEYIFGDNIHTVDCGCYGFLANIYYANMDTPLKKFICAMPNLVAYIERIHKGVNK
jgi:glutathione S-transferase